MDPLGQAGNHRRAVVHPRRRRSGHRREDYDLVVLDIELGRERHAGVAIINAINKSARGTPVLVVSAMPATIYRSIMKALDAWDYLQKTTFSEADFTDTFLEILRTAGDRSPGKPCLPSAKNFPSTRCARVPPGGAASGSICR
jgi:DNA-binding response OmpR family regulator